MSDNQSQPFSKPKAPTVLVIEDDGLIRQMLCAVFEAQDWVTNEASDGVEGLEQVAKELPNLIILDLMMPEMDGFEFAERLRSDPAFNNIPIIVLTAMVLDESDRSRLNPHVQEIIEKGGSPNYLYTLLMRAKQFMN